MHESIKLTEMEIEFQQYVVEVSRIFWSTKYTEMNVYEQSLLNLRYRSLFIKFSYKKILENFAGKLLQVLNLNQKILVSVITIYLYLFTIYFISLKVQPCKLCNSKSIISTTVVTNPEVFTFITVIVFRLLSRKALFINGKGKRKVKLLF